MERARLCPMWLERDTPLGRWAKGLVSRAHRNVAIVAFANKLARICLGGAAARRTVRRHRNAGGGIERGRSRSSVHRSTGVCERVTTGWPDSRTTLRKPGSKNGAI